MLAPKICGYFNLVPQIAETTMMSLAMFKQLKSWKVLTPLYVSLHKIKLDIIENRKGLSATITEIQLLEHGESQSASKIDDEWDFINDWIPAQHNRALKNMKTVLVNIRKRDPEAPMLDIVNGTSPHILNWEDIIMRRNGSRCIRH